ncbi:MAG: 30S ribosomal protein S3 [Candidatus Pacebacteria bacterium]|nr:30S ribosomal protein S3 [Candidatus Paceibacterota bacterium]
MGQKIKPTAIRIGVIKEWSSRWLPKGFRFGPLLHEDFVIRSVIMQKIKLAGVDSIVIEKTRGNYRVTIRTAKPGLIIGRGGKGVEELTTLLERSIAHLRAIRGLKEKVSLSLTIEEIKRYEVSAMVTAQQIAWDLEKRMPFRRTIKKYLERIMQNRDIKGAKIRVSGRLDGAEIARAEQLTLGSLPLQTLRANIDYAEGTAFTTYGTIGIKVWLYKGQIVGTTKEVSAQTRDLQIPRRSAPRPSHADGARHPRSTNTHRTPRS